MKKKTSINPAIISKNAEVAATVNKNQILLKKIGFAMAAIFGLIALYYCLIPALTQNATSDSQYVFFDNGLSKFAGNGDDVVAVYVYDDAEDTTADKVEMYQLTDVIANNPTLWSAVKTQLGSNVSANNTIKNVNTDNVYVSADPIALDKFVEFSGWDSGTVYDTVTNYRVNSASREWGYDYVDFQWVSTKTQLSTASGTCYYAPPQLMINRYAAEAATTPGGVKSPVQMIWEHGDTKGDQSSKPENSTSWVDPENANGRTFYDAVLTMNGEFGNITDINTLGKNSQSISNTLEGSVKLNGDGDIGLGTAKEYHTNATFFDYFSDWELAGNPLTKHLTSYTYSNADGNTIKPIWGMDVNYNTTAPVEIDFNADTLEAVGFRNIGTVNAVTRLMDANSPDHSGDMHILQLVEDAVAEYPLPSDATNKYFNVSIWGKAGKEEMQTVTMELYYQKDGSDYTVVLEKMSSTWNDAWTKIDGGSFFLPDGATNASIRLSATGTYRLDDFTLKYEGNGTAVSYVTETATETAKFPAGDFGGFANIGSGTMSIRDGINNDSHTADGSDGLHLYGTAVAEYKLPSSATGNDITASGWFLANTGNNTVRVAVSVHYELNGTPQSKTFDNSLSLTGSSGWTQLSTGEFDLPSGATNISIRYTPGGNINVYLDDFSVTYEKKKIEYVDIAKLGFASGELGGFELVKHANSGGSVSVQTNDGGNKGDHGTYTGDHALRGWSSATASYPITSGAGNYKFSTYIRPSNYGLSFMTISLHYKIGDTSYEERITPECLEGGGKIGSDANGAYYILPNVTETASEVAEGLKLNEQNKDETTWHGLAGSFTVPKNATDVQLWFRPYRAPATPDEYNSDASVHGTPTYYLDDFYLQHEEPVTIVKDVASAVTSDITSDYTRGTPGENGQPTKEYADYVGVTLSGVTTNKETVVKNCNGAQLYINTSDSSKLQGSNTYSNKENYLIEGNAFSYGKVTLEAIHYRNGTDVVLYKEVLAVYEPGAINISETFAPPIGTDATTITLTADNGIVIVDNLDIGLQLINTEGSFAEGTNTIAYSYQGNLFNDAISSYYIDKLGVTTDSIIPLYFGSNSWMTGNGRYYDADRHGQKLFTDAQITDAINGNDGAVYTITQSTVSGSKVDIVDDEGENPGSGAYIMPYSRQYWYTLYGFTEKRDNYPHGFSNSRAVDGLVTYDPSMDILMLDGTTVEAPYFNEEFLEGENDAYAAYGNVYRDVDFAFAYNEETGYYEFDSTRAWYATRLTQNQSGGYYMDYYNYDHLVTHNGDDVIYAEDPNFDYMGVKKADTSYDDGNGSSQTIYQFYPFNSPDTNDRFATENLMFGMKLDIPFNMLTKESERNNSMFKFSGDDDVWVYVDGKPVLDIGGTHTAVGGIIDLKNGYGVVGSSFESYTGISQTDSNNNVTIKDGQSGADQGVQKLEQAAFALLATLDEISIDPSKVTLEKLPRGSATGFVKADGGSGWSWLDSVSFFDVSYEPMADKQIGFQYQIRRLSDSDDLVIDVKVQNVKDISAEAGIAECVTFALSTFKLDGDEVEETEKADLMEHELTIYYLERGLNSSNFKLAFNFIDPAQREVEKVWADGNSEHINDDDFVDVELWRTEPEEGTASFSFPNDDYALVRAIAHQADSESVTSKFIEDDDQVTIQYSMNDSGVDSAATLTLNSMILSLEAYRQLYDSNLAMRIYVNDVEVSRNTGDATDDDDGDGNTLDPGEFYNPANAGDTNFVVKRDSLQTYDDGGEYNLTAIKLPDAENTIVKIVFKSKAVGASTNINNSTWGFRTSNTWLVEAYGYNRTEDTFMSVSDQNVLSDLMLDYVTVSGEIPVTLKASDMVIAIADAARQAEEKLADDTKVRYNHYAHNYFAYAVASDMSLSTDYTYSTEKDRQIDIWTATWDGPFSELNYAEKANKITVAAGAVHSTELKKTDDVDNKVYLIRYQHDEPYSDVGNGISCSSTMNAITYSKPVKIGGTETLNNASQWKALWNNIIESATLNGKVYKYRYFIREAAAKSTYGELLSDYKTTYYDAEGNEILPTIVNIDGKDVTLYSIDNIDPTSKKGYVKIVNNPITNATVKKDWANGSDKIPIVVKIYGENSENPGVITEVTKLSLTDENGYTAAIEALPLYVDDSASDTKGKMTYYAAEEVSGKYRASYNSDGVTKKLNGSDITVYPLNKASGETGTLSITVLNQEEGFVLEVNKVDDKGTTPLSGAEFVLYEYDEETDEWVVVEDDADTATVQSGDSVIDSTSGTLKSTGFSVLGSNISLMQTQKQATNVVTPGVYYDFSLSTTTDSGTNEYASYFDIVGIGELKTVSSFTYVDSPNKTLTKGLKMGSDQSITFTTGSSMFLTLGVVYYGEDDGIKITNLDGTSDPITIDTSEDKNRHFYAVELKQAATYSITRTGGQPYLCYLDFSTYNKYDAENFMKALNSSTWFQTEESFTLADELVNLQLTAPGSGWGLQFDTDYGYGGWQKDPDYYTGSDGHWYHAAIDNNVTTAHIRYLARAYQNESDAAKKAQYKNSVIAGIQCLLNAQYDNGGWPSLFKLDGTCSHNTYQSLITYNDNAMIRVMELLLEVRNKSGDFAGLVDNETQLITNSETAIKNGISCIINTQIELDGELTAWCQQYDEVSLQPENARAHELESLSADESVGIIKFLKTIQGDKTIAEQGDSYYSKSQIAAAINGAVEWLNTSVVRGYKYNKSVADGTSPLSYTGSDTDWIWSRYYAVDTIPPASDYVEGAENPYYYNGTKIQPYDSEGNPVTIQPNQSFFVERSETQTNSFYSYKDGNYYVTVFPELADLPDKQEKQYSWYGNWGRDYVTSTIKSDVTHNFATGADSAYFYFADTSIASKNADLTYGGETYTKSLKIGSTQHIIFTVEGNATLRALIRMRYDGEGELILTSLTSETDPKILKVVDQNTDDEGNYLLEYTLASGTYTLTKNGSEMYLYTLGVDVADESTEEPPVEPPVDTPEEDVDIPDEVPEGAKIFTSDATGKVLIGGLKAGKYCLVEVKPPVGYAPYRENIVFTILTDDNEAIRTDDVEYTPDEYVNLKWSETKELTLVATVKNKPYNINIPATGGRGIHILLLCGGAVMITAVVIFVRRRSRSYER